MGAELYSMVAAAGSLDIGGRTLFLSQYSITALGQIQAWLKERLPRPFAVVREALEDLAGLPPEIMQRAEALLLTAAHHDAKAGVVSMDAPQAEAQFHTADGVALLIWLAARPMHPELTFETTMELISKEPVDQLKRKIDKATQLLQESMRAEGAFGNPTTPASRPPATMDLDMQDITIIGNGRTGPSSSSR